MPHEFRISNKELSPYFIRSTDVSGLPSNDAIDPGDFDSDAQLSLREYWIVILKHQSLVLGLLVLMLTLTGVIVFTMTPVYTAASTLLIERQTPQILDIKAVTDEAQDGADQLDY